MSFYKTNHFPAFIFYALLVFSCSYSTAQNKKYTLQLFRRELSINNRDTVYTDLIVIKGYEEKSITIDSFVKIARNYIDTANGKKTITSICFMRFKKDEILPVVITDDDKEERKRYIIAVDFDWDKNTTTPIFSGFAIWHNEERFPYMNLNMLIPKHKLIIDSILNKPSYP